MPDCVKSTRLKFFIILCDCFLFSSQSKCLGEIHFIVSHTICYDSLLRSCIIKGAVRLSACLFVCCAISWACIDGFQWNQWRWIQGTPRKVCDVKKNGGFVCEHTMRNCKHQLGDLRPRQQHFNSEFHFGSFPLEVFFFLPSFNSAFGGKRGGLQWRTIDLVRV